MTTQVDAAAERHRLIADRLAALGRVEVGDLANRLDVAPETIRRDLRQLEQQGQLMRVHGGAVRRAERPLSPLDGSGPERSEQHRRLAAEVAAALPDCGAVYLGTSAILAAVAEALTRRTPASPQLTIVTTSLDVAVELSRAEGLTVFNIGGRVDHDTRAQQGEWALAELRRLRLDLALLPASGVTVDGVFTDSPMAGAMSTAAIQTAARCWLIAEAAVLGHTDFVDAGPINRFERLYTDGSPDTAMRARFADVGINLVAVQ